MNEHIDTAAIQADFDRIALFSSKAADEEWNHNNHYHRFLLEQVPANCTDALDIGCGTGSFARLLARRAKHVLALDLSPQTIELARECSTGVTNIDFEVADVLEKTFAPGQFNYIVSIATLHHIPMETILPGIKEALAEGGTLVVLDICQARLSDLFTELMAITANLYMQRIKHPRRSAVLPEARAAMEEHSAHDTYLTLSQVRRICQTYLPGARVRRHLFWRYSIVWKKPQS